MIEFVNFLGEKDISIDELVDICNSIPYAILERHSSQIDQDSLWLQQTPHDVRTHLTFRTGYSIHRACFLLVRKRTSCGSPPLFLIASLYLPNGNSSISAVSRGYIIISTEIRRWSFAASCNPHALVLFSVSYVHFLRQFSHFTFSLIFSSFSILIILHIKFPPSSLSQHDIYSHLACFY